TPGVGATDLSLAPPVVPWPHAEGHGPGPAYPRTGYAPSDWADNLPGPYRVWASGDFLAWEVRNAPLPALASTLPIGVIQVQTQNLLQKPDGTTVPFGNPVNTFTSLRIQSANTLAEGSALDLGEQLGGRVTAGLWLDPEESFGLETTAFFL